MITKITRGAIEFEFQGGIVRVQGEGHLPGGSVDYVIYAKLVCWQEPNDCKVMTPNLRKQIVEAIVREMEAKGMKVEVA